MSEELQSSMTSTSDYEVDDAGASSPVVSTINQLTPPSLNATQTETNPAVTPTNPTPETVRRGVWGATAAMRWAKKAKAKKIEENSEKSTLKSVAKRVNKQMKARTIITRWAHMSPMGRFAKDEEHLTFIREATRQVSMDIPAPIQHCIREEVLVILQDTLKQYRADLGAHHRLTEEMQKKIDEMREKIGTCTPKEHKKHSFLKRLSTVFLGGDHH